MCFRATMRKPLRSKRAITSPVRPRANASGFTRIRVLSKASPSCVGGSGAGRTLARALATALAARRRRLGRPASGWRVGRVGTGRGRRGGAAGASSRGRRLRGGLRVRHLRLAVRADLPQRVERLATRLAGLLQPSQAARAAQEGLLHLEPAVRAALLELG